MASISASLGSRVDRKGSRPTFLCTRCMAAAAGVWLQRGEVDGIGDGKRWREWKKDGGVRREEVVVQEDQVSQGRAGQGKVG